MRGEKLEKVRGQMRSAAPPRGAWARRHHPSLTLVCSEHRRWCCWSFSPHSGVLHPPEAPPGAAAPQRSWTYLRSCRNPPPPSGLHQHLPPPGCSSLHPSLVGLTHVKHFIFHSPKHLQPQNWSVGAPAGCGRQVHPQQIRVCEQQPVRHTPVTVNTFTWRRSSFDLQVDSRQQQRGF